MGLYLEEAFSCFRFLFFKANLVGSEASKNLHSTSFTFSSPVLLKFSLARKNGFFRNFQKSNPISPLELFRDNTGLPWWATIIGATILMRSTFTLPLAIYQQKRMGRLSSLQPLLKAWYETLKHETAFKSRAQNLPYETFEARLEGEWKQKLRQLYRDNDCHPIKSFILPWVQIPLFLSMSLTLRGMIDAQIPTFTGGGILWFKDLCSVDSTWIFPIAIGLMNLLNVEMNAWFTKQAASTRQRILRNCFRGLSIIMIPVASQVPMAICLYWFSSSTFSVIQNIVFRLPSVKTKLRFP